MYMHIKLQYILVHELTSIGGADMGLLAWPHRKKFPYAIKNFALPRNLWIGATGCLIILETPETSWVDGVSVEPKKDSFARRSMTLIFPWIDNHLPLFGLSGINPLNVAGGWISIGSSRPNHVWLWADFTMMHDDDWLEYLNSHFQARRKVTYEDEEDGEDDEDDEEMDIETILAEEFEVRTRLYCCSTFGS